MIKANFDIDKMFRDMRKHIEDVVMPAVLEALEIACMDTVSAAKQIDTYKDRTGNLRSSIGYVIYRDGEKIKEYFVPEPVKDGEIEETYRVKTKDGGIVTKTRKVKVGGDGEQGVQEGWLFTEEIAKKYPTGIVAVIVAGMDYAAAVESHGYDVLTGPCANLKDLFEERLKTAMSLIK
jgi:hypothetical protein